MTLHAMGIYIHSYLREEKKEKCKEANIVFLGVYQAGLTNVDSSLFGHYDSLQRYSEMPSWVF